MRVSSLGVADARGVAGDARPGVLWSDLGVDATGGRPSWKRVFEAPFPEFRRLDPLSRFACLAVEAAGLARLPEADRRDTALVLATTLGCLHADRRFARSLEGVVQPAVFPYTLPSTCLGELAIRHRLEGPNLCLTTAPGDESRGIAEAALLLDGGEARAAVVCLGDVVPEDGLLRLVALVVRASSGDDGDDDVPASLDALQEAAWTRA